MTNQTPHRSTVQRQTASREWFDTLVAETTHLDQLGVHAALLSIRLVKPTDLKRVAGQARALFGLILRPTDRVEQTSSSTFSVLLAPLADLSDTVQQANSICESLQNAGIAATAGFANRRPAESLLDTWARAEAQLDRASYRREHGAGITL